MHLGHVHNVGWGGGGGIESGLFESNYIWNFWED